DGLGVVDAVHRVAGEVTVAGQRVLRVEEVDEPVAVVVDAVADHLDGARVHQLGLRAAGAGLVAAVALGHRPAVAVAVGGAAVAGLAGARLAGVAGGAGVAAGPAVVGVLLRVHAGVAALGQAAAADRRARSAGAHLGGAAGLAAHAAV